MWNLRILPAVSLLALLTACATPSHDWLGVPAEIVTRDGRDYHVRLRRDGNTAQAQVIRTGWAGMRDHQPVIETMIAAAEEVSGCRSGPQVMSGDSGVLNLRLQCDAPMG